MNVITSDGRKIGSFESIQTIAREIKDSCALQGSLQGVHIETRHKNTASQLKPGLLLEDMELCHRRGEIYSQGGYIFLKKFAEKLYFLMDWACTLRTGRQVSTGHGRRHGKKSKRTNEGPKAVQVPITASEMEDFLKWLPNMMKAVGCYSINKDVSVDKALEQLG